MTFGRVSIKEAFFRVGFPGGLFLHHIDSKLLTRGGGAVVHLNGMHSGCRGGVIFSPVVEFWLEVSKKRHVGHSLEIHILNIIFPGGFVGRSFSFLCKWVICR